MSQAVPDVKTLLAARLAGEKDRYKLAVVAEGGAMRGIRTAAYCARLEAAGMSPHVDMWIGTSSGAMATTFAGAGNVRLGAASYGDALGPRGFYNDGASRRFIDWWRLGRQPVMDVAGLVDVVFDHIKPLDYARLRESPVPVCVAATGRDGQLHVLRLDRKSRDEVALGLKSTARIPLIAHPLNDREVLWDGSLSGHNMPLQLAVEMGASHVVMLKSAPEAGDSTRWLETMVVGPLVRARASDLYRVMNSRKAREQEVLARIAEKQTGLKILKIAPADNEVAMGEQDVGLLWRAASICWHQMGRVLDLGRAELPDEWASARAYV